MPFCSQCGSGVSGEHCSNCGTENPHFRDPNAEPEIALAQVSVAPVEHERARPWPLIESSLALAWPRLRKNMLWFVILAALYMLGMAYMLPLTSSTAHPPSTPAALGHFYEQLAPLMFTSLVTSFVIMLLSLGEAARARIAEFRWTPASVAGLLGWSLLVGVGAMFAVSIVLLIVLVPTLILMLSHAGVPTAKAAASPAVVGVTLAIMFLTMIPMGIWLGTKITLLAPSYVLGERSNPIGASWKLTDGYFWETFGFYALYMLVTLGILIVALGIGKLLASLTPLLALVGNLLEFAGAMWLHFAIAEGMVAWAVMLREAKAAGRQG
ncbi:MAG: zinc ribbon domain-containing protein [Candidatus Eremiobacteraeota bacterium]|nr:zinc ribbon domain-containing protein [Candidatus Eremiobacteraeota bacterium]NNM92966.1 zinc ribbon domain-containing protein [Candidatus Eremiobacteraeota bacterium]